MSVELQGSDERDSFVQIKLAMRKIEDRLEDGTLIVLKGHLVLEELLRMKVEAAVRQPEHLARANLSFFQVLCIARALFGNDVRSQIGAGGHIKSAWDVIEAWNQLRNRLAHKLEPMDMLPIIRRILYVTPDWPHPLEHEETQNGLTMTIGMLIGALGRL
jgi:hypothetical protein